MVGPRTVQQWCTEETEFMDIAVPIPDPKLDKVLVIASPMSLSFTLILIFYHINFHHAYEHTPWCGIPNVDCGSPKFSKEVFSKLILVSKDVHPFIHSLIMRYKG